MSAKEYQNRLVNYVAKKLPEWTTGIKDVKFLTFCAIAIELMKSSTPSKLRNAATLVETRSYKRSILDKDSEDHFLDQYLPIPRVVCLCGSMKFKDEFLRQQRIKTLYGEVVLTVGMFPHTEDGRSPEEVLGENTKAMLDHLHKQKILLCDYVFVINEGSYIGSSTKSEIEFATLVGKPVVYLEAVK